MSKAKSGARKPLRKKRERRMAAEAAAKGQLLLPAPAGDPPPEPPPEEPRKKQRRAFDDLYLEDMCAHIGMGNSLRAWAELTGHDAAHVVRWIQADGERQRQYREARKMQADSHIDALIELSDEPVPTSTFGTMDSAAVQDKRVRIDTRKWVAAKFYPSLYGDRVAVDASLDVSSLKPADVMTRIVALLATHGLRVTADTDAVDEPGQAA